MSNQWKGICEFDQNGYIIQGKPTWLASGEFQYFRMTREDWEPRLLQLKLAGFNTVSVYFAWNYHEVEEGVWDFSGDKDVELFLQTAAKVGLYVVARPGPFICNEWQCGGIPAWLTMRRDIRIRTADPQYLSYCDKWWDRIAPIIAKYQLGREGSIILAQVENEYGHVGEHQEGDYVYHLRDGLRARGVTVPITNCDSFIQFDRIRPKKWEDINLCCNAGGDGLRVLQRARTMQQDAPLFLTEFWIAAFDWWGRDGSAVYDDERALYGALEMVAGGAGGLTVFVFSGGANFGYWHGQSICSDGNFMTTIYGPGAPILDDGSLSRKYTLFKRNFTGLMTASEVLAGAGMPEITGDISGACTAVRRNGDTVFTFYINHSKEQMEIADAQKEQAAVDMSIPAGEVRWKVERLPLKSGFILNSTTGHLFAGDPALVIYQKAGEKTVISLTAEKGANGKEIRLEGSPKADGTPLVWNIEEDGKKLTVLLLSEEAVDLCYRIELPGHPAVIAGGLERIDSVTPRGEKMEITGFGGAYPTWKADEQGFAEWKTETEGELSVKTERLEEKKVSFQFEEAQPGYDDSGWYTAEMPEPMARFGKGNGRAWYRAELEVENEGWQMLFVSGASDRWIFFVDGHFCVSRGLHTHFGKDCAVYLTKGKHTLAILAENLGMYNTGFEMDIPMGEPKGIYGPVWMNGNEIKHWKMREGLRKDETYELWPQVGEVVWQEQKGKVKGPCYIKGRFSCPEGFEGAVRLDTHAAGKGSVWINGFNIGRYWKVGPQQSLWIPLSKLKKENEIVLFEEEGVDSEEITVIFTPFGKKRKGVL